jgi:ferredoxin, 2Fe-2S
MVCVIVTRRDGETRQVETKPGRSLMLNIRKDAEIAAICGGCASCGTCHVHVADDWLDRLLQMQDDEDTTLSFSDWRLPNSRLSCQIEMTGELDGLCVTVAPED